MSESSVSIQLQDGGTISALQRDGIITARGVPYASANRFEPPRPREKWEGVLDCTRPGPICPQPKSRLDALNGPVARGRAMSEDCLRVSVFAPAPIRTDELLPTMVWIHGGNYTTGAGDLDCYSEAGLAAKGVVVINITYRLGILGYQPIKGRVPANLGLMDQIAALRWVRDNARFFGGDAGRVCLFGQSAGGDSVYTLLGANGTEGLFHRAIIQSAPLGVRLTERQEMLTAPESAADELVPRDHADVPVEHLLAIQDTIVAKSFGYAAAGMVFAPRPNHDPLPDDATFLKQLDCAIRRVPIFIGYTRDEGTGFVPLFNHIDASKRPRFEGPLPEFISKAWFQDQAK